MSFLRTLFTLSTWFRTRKYKSGTGWCFWRWTDVDSEYILRLHVFKTPWFAVCLHWIRKPDAEPWLHDHPVSFLSIILRGSYTELRKDGDGKPYHKVNRWFNFVRASKDDRHRIILARTNTLTLCLMGPKTREWGFHKADEPGGWIMWKDYYARLRAGEDMRCEAFHVGLALKTLGEILYRHYTDARLRNLAGLGDLVDEEVRQISTVPGDFDDEANTSPRADSAYGDGEYGEKPYGN